MIQPKSTPYSLQLWSEIEALDQQSKDCLQQQALQEQLTYLAANSGFYRDKFAGTGIDLTKIQTIEQLQEIPFTEKQELRDSLAAFPPLGSHVAADLTEVVQVQASSGTTGNPSYVGLTEDDIVTWCELGARALYANGFRPGDRLLHGFGLSKGFVGGIPVFEIARFMGIADIPIGAEAGAERLLRVAANLRPNALIGTPAFLIYLAEQAPTVCGMLATEIGVRTISVGGEPGAGEPEMRSRIESAWGASSREMLGGTDLACTFWGECEAADGMHELSPDLIATELIDPQTGGPVDVVAGAEGELVYTALRRQASPLLRFRTRDHVVVTGTDCSCGRTGYKIRCVGRTDDMLIVRGINVYPSAVRELVLGFRPDATGEMRIQVDFEGHSTQQPLPLVVECRDGLEDDGRVRLKRDIEQRLRSALNVRVVVELVKDGALMRPDHVKATLVARG